MKFFFVFLIFILSLSFCLSASIEMEDSFYLGDNVVLKISANFYEAISPSDINFYRRHMLTSFENVKTIKIENEQYISFKVPLEKIPDNYSVNLTVKEKFFGTYQTNKISKTFVVLNETGRFYVPDNFIVVSENYQIYIENSLGENIEVRINPEINEEDKQEGFFANLFSKSSSSGEKINLKPYEGKFVNFEIGNETRLVKISLQSGDDLQNILVYEQVVEEEIRDEEDVKEDFIYENGEDKESIKEINNSENSSEEVNEEIGNDEKDENNKEIVEEEEDVIEEEGSILKNCEEMKGVKCDRNIEVCEGVIEEARDGVCCIGKCVEKKIDNSGKWVGWALLIIVIGSVGYAFLKSKQKRGEPLKLPKK